MKGRLQLCSDLLDRATQTGILLQYILHEMIVTYQIKAHGGVI